MTAPQSLFRKVRRMGRIDSSVEGSRFRRGEHPRPPTELDRGRNQQMTGGWFRWCPVPNSRCSSLSKQRHTNAFGCRIWSSEAS